MHVSQEAAQTAHRDWCPGALKSLPCDRDWCPRALKSLPCVATPTAMNKRGREVGTTPEKQRKEYDPKAPEDH